MPHLTSATLSPMPFSWNPAIGAHIFRSSGLSYARQAPWSHGEEPLTSPATSKMCVLACQKQPFPACPCAIKKIGRTKMEIDLCQPIDSMINHICRIFKPITQPGKRGVKLDNSDPLYIWEQYQQGKSIHGIAREYRTEPKDIPR